MTRSEWIICRAVVNAASVPAQAVVRVSSPDGVKGELGKMVDPAPELVLEMEGVRSRELGSPAQPSPAQLSWVACRLAS